MAKDDMETCHDRGQRQGGSANCRWAETDTSHRWRVERWAGRPPPASHVFIVMRLNMSTLGGLVAASTQAGSFRWEAEDVLLLDAPASSWQQPESRLLRRASHRGTQGPTRPPNHSVQTGPPHREQSGGGARRGLTEEEGRAEKASTSPTLDDLTD